ncbi:MAG: NUDIX hydrolase [Bacilli bacterium]|jgi:8-oxo-dGTP pyrophosphatase MutT (NUDIX family)|nr:NUDIX domain-containing protein [Acholeplasmataceae bacterium]
MKVIAVFDDKDYDENWSRFTRRAVRAVIIKNNRIALVKCEKEGYYKFPGGGIKNGESHLETLIRETSEETGLQIIPDSIKELGMIHEIRKSHYPREIFDQKSYYYFAEVEKEKGNAHPEQYEIDLGFKLEWTELDTAYKTNICLGKNYQEKFILREAEVLKLLLNKR